MTGKSDPKMPRRHIFRALAGEALAWADEAGGRSQLSLNDLDRVPDEIMEDWIPVFMDHQGIRIQGDRLTVVRKGQAEAGEIYRFDPLESYLLECFHQGIPLGEISEILTLERRLDPGSAWRFVRSFFTTLARHGLVRPDAPYHPPEPSS